MPKFFVPFADDHKQAEHVYGVFVKNSTYPPASPNARLFSITFRYRKSVCVAEVGSEITNWPEEVRPVLGITEATQLVCVHTQLRGGLSATPIYVSPEEVTDRVYFDDYPAITQLR